MKLSWSRSQPVFGITWAGKDRTSVAFPVSIATKYTAGIVGPPGANGTSGINGATGAPGAIGIQGIQGTLGPPGPQGDQGPAGNLTSDILIFDVLSFGDQILSLGRSVLKVHLFLNGLFQDPAYYTVLGNQIIVPVEMGCMPGDVIIVTY